MKAQVAHQLDLLRATRPREELHLHKVGGVDGRILREKPDPAEVAPKKRDKTLVGQALFQGRLQFLPHVFDLLERAEHERQILDGADRVIDLGEADDAQQPGLNLSHPHSLDHVRLAAHDPVRIDGECHTSARRLAPLLAHGQQDFVWRRASGDERGQLDADGRVSSK